MNTRKWFCAFSLCVLLQAFGTSRTAQAQISIDANSELTAPFTATYDPQNDEVDFSPGGFSLTLSVTLNIALPLSVTFNGSYSPSWGDAANWDGVNLLVTAGSIGVDVFKSAGDGNGVPEWTLAKDVFNALGTTGGPTEKTVTGGIETFKYQTSSKDPLLSGSFGLNASLGFKFDVTIPSGKTAIMNQSPVVLEHLTNSGNLTGNGNGLTINQDLQNTGILQGFGAALQGNFTNSAGASATITGGLGIQGGFQNSGTLVISANGSVSRTAATTNNGTLTLNGGQLSLPNGLTDQGMVDGYGTLKININENGTFIADVPSQVLAISTDGVSFSPVVTNSGTLGATNGGTLSLVSATVNGGAITANNGTVTLSNAIINGSTLSGGANDLFSGSASLTNVVNNAKIYSYNGIGVYGGSLVNNGTITIGAGIVSGYDTLSFSADTTLGGTGTIALNGGVVTGGHTATLSQQIHGWGIIETALNTSGNITADVSGQTLSLYPAATINSTGVLQVINGSNLLIYSAVSGGAITANNGTVNMSNATITGCTLNGGANDMFSLSNVEFTHVINNANLFTYNEIYIGDASLTNNGSITIGNGGSTQNLNALLYSSTDTNLAGSGAIILNGGGLEGGHTTTTSQMIHGWGFIQTTLTSSGTIQADAYGKTLNVGYQSAATINNLGTIGASNGGNLDVRYATVNGGAITANGGTVSIESEIVGSTLNGGANDLFTVNGGDLNAIVNNAQILSSTGLSISGGSLINNGTITVGTGTSSNPQLALTAATTLSGAGTIVLNNGLVRGSYAATQAAGHKLLGVGTVSSPFTSAGTVAPGFPFGTLAFSNGLSLNNTSHLVFAIGGSPASTSYDHITVTGTASLNGALDLKLANNFVPNLGDTFQIMTFGAATGKFTALNGLIINQDLAFSVSVTATAVTLTVVNTDFARWKAAEFGANASNPAIAGALADPDGDGIPNLLEYAFGLNPTVASQSGLPILGTMQVGSSSYLSLTYRQLIATTQLSYVVGVSGDLQTWDWSEAQIQQVGTPMPTGDGLTELVIVRMNTPINTTAHQFMRLSVTESF